MTIRIHPHAAARMAERGAMLEEVEATVNAGERFPARFGRIGFRRNFAFGADWRGRYYQTKQVEAYAVEEDGVAGDHGPREVFLMVQGGVP